MPKQYIKTLLRNYLLQGKTITSLQALRRWGTIRLPVYVKRLRDDGYKVKRQMVKEKGKTFAKYYL